MAENLSPEALELKRRGRRRLIGAGTIALLAVIVLPMIFDAEPKRAGKETQEIAITIPAKDSLPALPAAVPAKAAPPEAPAAPAPGTAGTDAPKTEPAKTETKAAAASADPVAAAATAPAPAKPAAAVAAKAEPPKADPRPEPAARPAARKEGFAVQLGAFSDPDNVKQLRARLAPAKLPVYTEELKTAAGTSTRVRAGPFKTREQAERALLQVKKAGIDGAKVVPLS